MHTFDFVLFVCVCVCVGGGGGRGEGGDEGRRELLVEYQ